LTSGDVNEEVLLDHGGNIKSLGIRM